MVTLHHVPFGTQSKKHEDLQWPECSLRAAMPTPLASYLLPPGGAPGGGNLKN